MNEPTMSLRMTDERGDRLRRGDTAHRQERKCTKACNTLTIASFEQGIGGGSHCHHSRAILPPFAPESGERRSFSSRPPGWASPPKCGVSESLTGDSLYTIPRPSVIGGENPSPPSPSGASTPIPDAPNRGSDSVGVQPRTEALKETSSLFN